MKKLILLLAISYWLLAIAPLPVHADPPAAEAPADPCAPPDPDEPDTRSEAQKIRCSYQGFFGRAGFVPDRIGGEGVVTNPLAARIGVIIRTALSLVGIVFLGITVYSGIQWMMAGGNEEKIEKAQTRIKRATIGILIIVGSWFITNFVIGRAIGPVRPSGGAQIRLFVE